MSGRVDVPYHVAFGDLAGIYLEDSWVLGVVPTDRALTFDIEAVLTPDHAEYRARHPGEQHCFRRAVLTVASAVSIAFQPGSRPPGVDASGELDYGNIEAFHALDGEGPETWELTGYWGVALVRQPSVTLTLNPLVD